MAKHHSSTFHKNGICRMYTPLFQLIKLLNYLKADENDKILGKIALKNISYSGFSSHVTFIFRNTYDPICRITNCFVCRQR